jgi:hypothetical protein
VKRYLKIKGLKLCIYDVAGRMLAQSDPFVAFGHRQTHVLCATPFDTFVAATGVAAFYRVFLESGVQLVEGLCVLRSSPLARHEMSVTGFTTLYFGVGDHLHISAFSIHFLTPLEKDPRLVSR